MENIKHKLSLFFGLFLFLFDHGSDIYVAVQYWKNGETWWFWLTVAFIVLPSIIVNITAIVQQRNMISFIAGFFQLSIVTRYLEAIFRYDHVTPRRIYSLAKLRYLETITESAPQWCLQVYIMLRQWSFPPFTIASSILSFLSLVWSIRTLEKKRAEFKAVDFSLCEAIIFLTWQMFTLVSRVSAIVIIGYLFPYALLFLPFHCLLLTLLFICSCQRCSEGNATGFLESLLPTFLATYPSIYHPANLDDMLPIKKPKAKMILAYISIHVENILMVALSSTIELPDAKHMDVLKPVAIWCHAGGTMISFIFFLLMMCWKDNATLLKQAMPNIPCPCCPDQCQHFQPPIQGPEHSDYGTEQYSGIQRNEENTPLLPPDNYYT
ncbi:XK-related protein 8-like [Dendronephthya gigantea]|uniref:XK-related protein 8-like n=1 Tax=Dendronephthya gigantea TaxID=151771 RepID=UPI00106C42BB|nr:XK-related protein 8-like [Dendronephthya gigantea]